MEHPTAQDSNKVDYIHHTSIFLSKTPPLKNIEYQHLKVIQKVPIRYVNNWSQCFLFPQHSCHVPVHNSSKRKYKSCFQYHRKQAVNHFWCSSWSPHQWFQMIRIMIVLYPLILMKNSCHMHFVWKVGSKITRGWLLHALFNFLLTIHIIHSHPFNQFTHSLIVYPKNTRLRTVQNMTVAE